MADETETVSIDVSEYEFSNLLMNDIEAVRDLICNSDDTIRLKVRTYSNRNETLKTITEIKSLLDKIENRINKFDEKLNKKYKG